MIPGMNVGVEAFHPVGHEFNRSAQQFGYRIGRHLVGVDMNLDAERAAHVLANDADLRLLKPEMQSRDVLHHMRRLRALVDGEPFFGFAPVSHDRP